jgi:hypothetical protein
MKAICLITYKPNDIFLDFLQNFKNYDIYVVIDDNQYYYQNIRLKYKNIHFIQIRNINCLKNGFKHTSYITLKKEVTGWDKALYYFSFHYYDYVWFMEDDVYLYNENTLINIDNKYPYQDILCNCNFKNANLNEWLWNKIQIKIEPPYYCGMMCVVRMSKHMLYSIKEYASKNNTLFFLEALFPTLAVKYHLTYSNPEEFNTITHRDVHTTFNKMHLYHPVKNLELHTKERKSKYFIWW